MTFSRQGAVITCPNCHTQFSAQIDQILDVQQDPAAKIELLTGQATTVQCPNCGFVLTVATPLAYHDASKELLLIHIPMELNLSNQEQERIVGQMTRAITDSLSMEQRKGYLLNPRRTFTLQGMIEAVHEADGVTKQMLEARRQKVAFLQELLEADDEQRDAMIEEFDADIDEEFFQMMSVMIETALVNGQQQEAGYIATVRDELLGKTTYGQEVLASMQAQEATVQEVATVLQAMGQNATRESILDLAVEFSESDDHLRGEFRNGQWSFL
ncbi:MAG: CpXC domain-containing protein, partial [Chloroflexi bacterium]|nr:CpXC domain-containing protein [Chloroflexota bacterium]